jgi:multidrug efflux pump subunit AcrA (membrane-fusion protein)
MDLPRPAKHKNRPYLLTALTLAGIVLVTLGLSRLRPAAPSVERATLWVDTVKRGPMLREVRGAGTLVPEQIRWVSALTAGRVERILAQPGEKVEEHTLLLEMSNPDVQLEALDAHRQLSLAESELASLHASLQTQMLAQEAALATVRREHQNAKRALAAAERLHQENLNSAYEVERAREEAQEQQTRFEAEQKSLEISRETMKTQLDLRRNQVERLKAIVRFQQGQVASMKVQAGATGVLQELPLQVGQWVNPGQLLAKVVQPERLKATLRIPETQAKDLALGLQAVVDTRNGTVAGRVVRIDPAVQEGTVAVDVALVGTLPQGARPDLSVDGNIEIERLASVLYVGRPAFGQPHSTVSIFKLVEGGRHAERVRVKLGRTSVSTVEILEGLREGDQVILSEMSQWDDAERVRLR